MKTEIKKIIEEAQGGNLAEKVAALLGDDGQIFETEDGTSLDELCLKAGAVKEGALNVNGRIVECSAYEAEHTGGGMVRYVFPDGSVLVVAGDCWDFEGDKPFRFEGER